jgi:hypothetical protein
MTAQEYILNKDLLDESDIVGILWYDENIEPIDKINISLELFDRSPEYAICIELKMAFNEMSTKIRNILWKKYKDYLLTGTDKQKEQIKYSLWVDFFEDPETVDEAWSKIVTESSEIDILRQVLSISGPVPFDKKDKLYLKVIADKTNHKYILESLVGSFFDVFGQINFQRARILLPTLKVDRETENYNKLNECLKKFNSKTEYWDFVKNKKDANTM